MNALDQNSPGSIAPTFASEIQSRGTELRLAVEAASAAGDDDLADALSGELDGLVELAAANDVLLVDAADFLARRSGQVLDLTTPEIRTA